VTMNPLEGGNWRVKRRVRNPFSRIDSIAGKSLLAVSEIPSSQSGAGSPCPAPRRRWGSSASAW
jgi:hypothetical protein